MPNAKPDADADAELSNLRVRRISLLVGKEPANGKAVLLYKSKNADGGDDMEIRLESVSTELAKAFKAAAAHGEKDENVEETKALSVFAEAKRPIVRAVARVFQAFKGELDDDDMRKLAGMLGLHPGGKPEEDEEEKTKALKTAVDTLTKERDAALAKAAPPRQPGDLPDPIFKSGSTTDLDFDAVPAEQRPLAKAVWPERLARQRIEKELAEQRLVMKARDFADKATAFPHVGAAKDLGPMLMAIAGAVPAEVYKQLEDRLAQAEVLAAESTLFREVGMRGAAPAPDSPYGRLEQMAKAVVAKSGSGLTFEQAMAQVMAEPEGMKLYDDYRKERREARA